MSVLGLLSADFSIMLEDWGEEITIIHNLSTQLDPSTGEYITTIATATLQGVISKIEKTEITMNPIKYQVTDIKIRYRKVDTTIFLIIDDIITYNSNSYKVLSTNLIKGIWEAIIRRVE